MKIRLLTGHGHSLVAQSAEAVEYTECISAESKTPPTNDTKQSNDEAAVIQELWVMRSTPSLLSLPGSLLSGVVAPDRVLSMD